MVAPNLERALLPLELDVTLPSVRGERTVAQCRADGAARLGPVRAVGEPAAKRDLLDIAECLVEVRIPELQLADARRVEHDSARRQYDELATRGRVAAAMVVLAHLPCLEQLLADEGIDERRLADARRADEHRGPIALEPPTHVLETVTADGRDQVHRARAEGDRLRLVEEPRVVVDEVDLREENDRLRPALPRHREVALEPTCIEVQRKRLDQECDVDVRGEHLLARRIEGLLPRESRPPRQDGLDEHRLRVEPDPVADRRQLVFAGKACSGSRADRVLSVRQVVRSPVLNSDAGGNEASGAMLGERGLPAVVPAETLER